MSNKLRGNVDFTVGGNTYTLCFDHNALIELEELLDRGLVAISNEMQKWQTDPERIRLKWIRAFLYAGLKKNQPKMTLEDVSDLMGEAGHGPAIMDAIGDAMAAAFGAVSKASGDVRPTNGGVPSTTGSEPLPSTYPMDTSSALSGPSRRPS